jgi:hypothetical protein
MFIYETLNLGAEFNTYNTGLIHVLYVLYPEKIRLQCPV